MNNEHQVYDARGMLVRGEVLAIDDSTPLQTIDVKTHDGVVRAGVEVPQMWGAVSVAPKGAVAVLALIGGDPADAMALSVTHPGARAGGAASGTLGWCDNGGNRMLILPGGAIEIVAATSITLTVGGTSLQITPAGVTITGDLTVTGAIHGTADFANTTHHLG